MSNSAFQLQFAAELVTMLVAAAGVLLVVLGAELTARASWARVALAGGFVALGAAAFVHGSLLSPDMSAMSRWGIGALRLVGDAAVAAGCLRWRAGRPVRIVLWCGVLAGAAAAALEMADGPATAVDVGIIVGSSGVAVALIAGSRRSIVARVAAGTAATLLLVVLVVSLALSSVIANSTEHDQLAALASRAQVESGSALAQGTAALEDARLVAADLQAYFHVDPAPLVGLQATPDPSGAAAAAVSSRLGALADLHPTEGLAYVVASAVVLAPQPEPGASSRLRVLAGQVPVTSLSCADTSGHSLVAVVKGALVAAAAYPECLAPAGAAGVLGARDTLLGVVLVSTPLGDGYLAARRVIDPTASLAIVAGGTVLASAGAVPPAIRLRAAALPVAASGRSAVVAEPGWELAVAPLATAPGHPPAVLVSATTDASVVAVRTRLERTLFLIALGGTVIALLFVAAIGERVTAGLRRLTAVALRIRRGGSGERAGITSRDEVGALSAAFDAMLAAIEKQTAALQGAADDETRLRNRLQAVVAGMGDALIATDSRGAVTEFNAAAEALTGVPGRAAMGAAMADVIDIVGSDGGQLGERLAHPNAPWSQRAVLRRGRGEEIPVAMSAGVLRGPGGEQAGGVLVLRDLRREEEIERMKSEFLSRVGHELRTPLTAIVGYSEILTYRGATAAQSEVWHQEILGSAKRLTRIVEMVEFVASSGAGRAPLRPESHDTGAFVREVAAPWPERLREGQVLRLDVAPGTPPVVADRRWLRLALDELLDNAVKFSPGGGEISLRARPVSAGREVEITVSDQGVGMAPDEQARAFGEFVQGDPSDTRRFGGLGLGLALVQRVVEGHRGSVHCDAAPGAGTRLTVRLPAAP